MAQNDVHDKLNNNHEEEIDDVDESASVGMMASLWAKAPSLPTNPLSYVQEAPGALVSLWRSAPSIQGVASAVQGSMKIPSMLQSVVPGYYGIKGDSVSKEKDIVTAMNDEASLHSPVKSSVNVDASVVKKVENKKQS